MEDELFFQDLLAVKGCDKVQMRSTFFDQLVHLGLLHLLVVDANVPEGERSAWWTSDKPGGILRVDQIPRHAPI